MKIDTAPAERRKSGLLGKLGRALQRTRGALLGGLESLFQPGRRLDDRLVEEIETRLLLADVGVDASERIVAALKKRAGDVADAQGAIEVVRAEMLTILEPVAVPLTIPQGGATPFVILVVGVNGAGKTTTIGKLASQLQGEGRRVLLAAGDTFRAAAIEQLQTWAERCAVPIVAQRSGSDSASVIYDAFQAARARGIDVLIADTAGRLHTQSGLMQELAKIRRVLAKVDADAPHETLLVLDAGIGQNALVQAQVFKEQIGVSGLALTKLDGTAKGGVVVAIASRFGVPIRYIGVGEKIDDLRPFEARAFVSALLSQ